MKKIEVRCPMCHEWGRVESSLLGQEVLCPNCNQFTVPVPRSTAARQWRAFLKVLIVIGGAVVFYALYNYRLNEMTRSMGGFEMPDVSRSRLEIIERQAQIEAHKTTEKTNAELKAMARTNIYMRQALERIERKQ